MTEQFSAFLAPLLPMLPLLPRPFPIGRPTSATVHPRNWRPECGGGGELSRLLLILVGVGLGKGKGKEQSLLLEIFSIP